MFGSAGSVHVPRGVKYDDPVAAQTIAEPRCVDELRFRRCCARRSCAGAAHEHSRANCGTDDACSGQHCADVSYQTPSAARRQLRAHAILLANWQFDDNLKTICWRACQQMRCPSSKFQTPAHRATMAARDEYMAHAGAAVGAGGGVGRTASPRDVHRYAGSRASAGAADAGAPRRAVRALLAVLGAACAST